MEKELGLERGEFCDWFEKVRQEYNAEEQDVDLIYYAECYADGHTADKEDMRVFLNA